MKRTFAYGAAANQGLWPVQEDGFFVDPSRGLFVLADGFGGRGNGDIAVKLAIQEWRGAKPDPGVPSQAWQAGIFSEINKKLLQWNEKRAPGAKGGCSLIAASVSQERELTLTSCGACSAFLLRAGAWLPLLTPQAAPRLHPGDALFPQQSIGTGKDLSLEARCLLWEPGDFLFLFSSGLAWEREGFQAELSAQLALRLPGSNLSDVASLAAEVGHGNGLEATWNRTALAVESLL